MLQRMPAEAQSGPKILAIVWRSRNVAAQQVVSSPYSKYRIRAAPREQPVSPRASRREEITMSKKTTKRRGERGQPWGTPPCRVKVSFGFPGLKAVEQNRVCL